MKDLTNLCSYIQLTISSGYLQALHIREGDEVSYNEGSYKVKYIDEKTNIDILHLEKLVNKEV